MKQIYLYLLIVFAVTPALAMAQARHGANAPVLTLAGAIEEALENNYALKSSNYDVKVAKTAIGPAGSLDDPSLGIAALSYPLPGFSPRKSEMTGNELSISQRLRWPGKLGALEEEAKQRYLYKESEFENSKLMLIREVKRSYISLALEYKKRELLQEKKKILEQSLANAKNKLTAGSGSQEEVLGMEVELSTLEGQLVDAGKNIEVALGDLNHLLGRNNHDHDVMTEPLALTNRRLAGQSEEALLDLASSNNPMLKALEARSREAQARLDYEKLNKLPDYDLMIGYLQRLPTQGMDGDDMLSARVSVPLPVWGSTKQSEQLAGAMLMQQQVAAAVAEEKSHILHYIHTALSEVAAARERSELLGKNLIPLADSAIETALSSYSTGSSGASYAVLLNLVNRRFEADEQRFEAVAEHEAALAWLESLIGEEHE